MGRSTPAWSPEPSDKRTYTRRFDKFYSRSARLYGKVVHFLPVWRRWTGFALPHLKGPRVLEIAFGTGELMSRYANRFDSYGVDYNAAMVRVAQANLRRHDLVAQLQQASVERLPYAAGTMDTVVSTMSFTGFPDGRQALQEMRRVLRPRGRLVIVDVSYPSDGNWAGSLMTRVWMATGDLIRDMGALFGELGWRCDDYEVGGYGSVHLYLAQKE